MTTTTKSIFLLSFLGTVGKGFASRGTKTQSSSSKYEPLQSVYSLPDTFAEAWEQHDEEQKFKEQENIYDYIIIGAGWSGLSAAKTLEESGVTNFVVLDAHDYVGGRSKTSAIHNDVLIEEGSVWLNGIGDNIVYDEVLLKYDIGYSLYNDHLIAVFMNGMSYYIPDAVVDKFEEYYKGIYDAWTNYADRLTEDSSYDTLLDYYAADLGILEDSEQMALFNAATELTIRYEYAADTSKFSTWGGNENMNKVGGSLVLKGGFSNMVHKYAESFRQKILLNRKVTKISYGSDPVVLEGTDSNGESFSIKGKKVLSTIPTGVLKAGTVEFDPPFSQQGDAGKRKQDAIDHLNPGQLEKIILYWEDMAEDEIFWAKDNVHFFVHVAEDETIQGNFTYWNNFHRQNGAPMLVAFVTGDYAMDVQDLKDEEVVAAAVDRLRSYYEPDVVVPEPTHSHVTRWMEEETTKTIYTYAEVGGHPEIRSHMSEPLEGRLFFAGEATFERHLGTVHGAFYSGVRAAHLMLDKWWRPVVYEFLQYYFPFTSPYCRRLFL